MTTAQYLQETFKGAELLEKANAAAVEFDQDWVEESTTFTFDDGSFLTIAA